MSDKIEQKYAEMYDMITTPMAESIVPDEIKVPDPTCAIEISDADRAHNNQTSEEIPYEEPVEYEPIPQPGVNPLRKINAFSRKIIKDAQAKNKIFPHELLLYWANGIPIGGFTPTPAQQLYAAVSCAPYYAPKLANVEVKQDVRVRAVISAQPMTQEQWAAKYIQGDSSNTPTPQIVETERVNDDDDTI